MQLMNNRRITALFFIIVLLGAGYFIYRNQAETSSFPFKYGLDLAGGTELTYEADISQVDSGDVESSMQALRDVIERRVNLFGVSEPIVQVEKAGIFSVEESAHRLIVELPGITDIDQAVSLIGETPVLEFKLMANDIDIDNLTEDENELFIDTGLTGRYLESAQLEFSGGTVNASVSEPVVLLHFDEAGEKLFAEITRDNVGTILAIFLDGQPISTPVIREEIDGGTAQITGTFTATEARDLVRDLNFGALPVPISLINTQKIGSTLGQDTLQSGVYAGIIGLGIVCLFLVMWYRLSGVFAVISLALYVALILALFKLVPVVLTAAGIAGFILSIGMAVDANVLIFERVKEEVRGGRNIQEALREGFQRAWPSIRDANITSLLTAVILFWFGTSLVKGFALTFGLGVLMSMFTAIVVTKSFMLALPIKRAFWFKSGFNK